MTEFIKTTEQDSKYRNLEKMSTKELLVNMNNEDKTVPLAVEKAIPQIQKLVDVIVAKMQEGGRLFYIGAGTSGRLGILDASEIPPTFGASPDLVKGLIAGGKVAITNAVENAEDDKQQGWFDLQSYHIGEEDVVIGIAASGTTPYVIGAIEKCNANNIVTGCVVSNKNAPLAKVAKYPIEVVVGPEFVTGSSRLKSGTAQKLVLNMITTTTMIKLGRVQDNKMVNMQLTNEKLVDRGTKMLMQELNIQDYDKAKSLLKEFGSVLKAINSTKNSK